MDQWDLLTATWISYTIRKFQAAGLVNPKDKLMIISQHIIKIIFVVVCFGYLYLFILLQQATVCMHKIQVQRWVQSLIEGAELIKVSFVVKY